MMPDVGKGLQKKMGRLEFCNNHQCQLGTDHLTCSGGMVFCFVQNFFFSVNTRVRTFIFVVVLSAIFFLQNLTLGYMTKTLNQIIFFFLHQNKKFSATLGIRIFF